VSCISLDAALKKQIGHNEVVVLGRSYGEVTSVAGIFVLITTRFGERVLQLVSQLSDDKSQPRAVRRQLVLEHLQSAEIAVRLIKLADLCSNIQSVPADWTSERRQEYLDYSARAAHLCRGANPALDRMYEERASSVRGAS
jgi:hypothetical protein